MSNSIPSSSGSTSHKQPNITYRKIQRSDKDALKQLHDEFFPVKYSDNFYNEMIEERGMHGLPLFTVIAVNEQQEIIGFLLAQLLDYPMRSEDVDLFQFGHAPQQICYILTLGVKSEYRRYGIASILIGRCIDFAAASESCGAVRYSLCLLTLTCFIRICLCRFISTSFITIPLHSVYIAKITSFTCEHCRISI